MLELVKLALRVTEDDFEDEIELYIADALAEMRMLGITEETPDDTTHDEQITAAVIFYCKWKFGDNGTAEKWEHIYRDKVEKLMHATGYGLPDDEGT